MENSLCKGFFISVFFDLVWNPLLVGWHSGEDLRLSIHQTVLGPKACDSLKFPGSACSRFTNQSSFCVTLKRKLAHNTLYKMIQCNKASLYPPPCTHTHLFAARNLIILKSFHCWVLKAAGHAKDEVLYLAVLPFVYLIFALFKSYLMHPLPRAVAPSPIPTSLLCHRSCQKEPQNAAGDQVAN